MTKYSVLAAVFALAIAAVTWNRSQADAPEDPTVKRIPVEIIGGHDTYGPDKGRPVVLIAAALKVPTEVFREAFSHVQPAPAGQRPSPDQERRNKAELLKVLAPYGVTNDRLDEVSNYYRYQRSRGEIWPTQNAEAYALVKDGKITGFEIAKGGSGYSSVPTVKVPGMEAVKLEAKLGFSTEFENNGALSSIAPAAEK